MMRPRATTTTTTPYAAARAAVGQHIPLSPLHHRGGGAGATAPPVSIFFRLGAQTSPPISFSWIDARPRGHPLPIDRSRAAVGTRTPTPNPLAATTAAPPPPLAGFHGVALSVSRSMPSPSACSEPGAPLPPPRSLWPAHALALPPDDPDSDPDRRLPPLGVACKCARLA